MSASVGAGLKALVADRRRGAWLAALAAVLVYANALGFGFAYDDAVLVRDNVALHSWRGVLGSLGAPYWSGPYGAGLGLWRPVPVLWWGAQWLVWGDRPALFHVLAVGLHAGVAALVVLVLGELLPVAAAVLAGLVFALHPVHVEAVANVAGSAEPLAALFALAACLLHLRGGERYGWARALGVGACFALSALTKEIAFTLPAVLFLLDAARRDVGPADLGSYLRKRWRPYLALGVVTAALLLARAQILGGLAPDQVPTGASRLTEVGRLWTVPNLWTHYVRLMVFPLDLNAEYGGIIPVEVEWGVRNLTGVAVALLFLGLAWWAWRTGAPLEPARSSRRALGFAVVWFGVTVLPASNIVFQSGVLIAERNLYLPSIGAAAGAGWLLAEMLERRRAAALATIGAVAGLMALRTMTATPRWRTTEGLFADLFERHPEVGKGWYFYADQLFKAGRQQEARRAFAVLLLIDDSEYTMATEVGSRLSAMDEASPRAAEFLLKRAWREQPGLYTAPGFLAAHYLNHEQYREGESPARAAMMLAPENLDLPRILAALLSGQGRASEAIPYRLGAIAAGGGGPWRQWVSLADDYLTVGDTTAALAALDSARVRSPSPDIRAALDARLDEVGGAARAEPGS